MPGAPWRPAPARPCDLGAVRCRHLGGARTGPAPPPGWAGCRSFAPP